MTMSIFKPHFLVVSLGNRGRYYETLHSAGHFALRSLQKAIVANSAAAGAESPEQEQPPFVKEDPNGFKRKYWGSYGSKYTLMESATPMNVSGVFLKCHWDRILEERGMQPSELGLVVVHDDLEEDFGAVLVREWKRSHRGHNGVKSIGLRLKPKDYPGSYWSRISVGIDRPESREIKDVSDYVLSPLTDRQKEILDTEVGSKVLACLQTIEMQWKEAFEKAAAEASTPPPE